MTTVEQQSTWRDPTGRFPYPIRGASRAGRYTGFEFAGVFLDAGHRTDVQPRAVLITHTHTDHVNELAHICMNKKDTFNIFCAPEALLPLQTYLTAVAGLRSCSTRIQWNSVLFSGKLTTVGNTYVPLGWRIDGDGWHPHFPDALKGLAVRALPLRHSVPDVGYVIAHHEADGTFTPLLAYLCDGTSESMAQAIDTLALTGLPYVVMLECSYITQAQEVEAVARRHVCWTKIYPTLMKYPTISFVLFHFSLRTSEKDLRKFATTLPPHIFAFL